jgi:cbb3-type cytochrome oxidase cytochrome c subunit
MSIITSNQPKRQISIDPIFILFFSVLLVLLVFAISAANGSSLVEKVLQTRDNAPAAGVSLNTQVSFAADQLYWSENCESGWSEDATCEAIVARTQSCSISVDSTYCSAYENYLQEFNH